MDLSIIIVSYNVKEKLRENLKTLQLSQVNFDIEVIIVDNASADGSAEMMAGEFKNVFLINNSDNYGFAKACNQGIEKASGRYILLLNPDMKVFPDTLQNMIDWMDKNPQADVAGCNLIDEQGNTIKHVRRFPTIWDQLVIVLKLPHLVPGILNNYLRVDFDYTKAESVDSIRGGFFMLRAGVQGHIPVWLDERYFVWFEEVDFCRKIKAAGGQVWYTPAAKCVDYVGQSFKQLPSLKKQILFRNSMLEYFKKWEPSWQYWLLFIVWPLGIFITWLGEKSNFKSKVKT